MSSRGESVGVLNLSPDNAEIVREKRLNIGGNFLLSPLTALPIAFATARRKDNGWVINPAYFISLAAFCKCVATTYPFVPSI